MPIEKTQIFWHIIGKIQTPWQALRKFKLVWLFQTKQVPLPPIFVQLHATSRVAPPKSSLRSNGPSKRLKAWIWCTLERMVVLFACCCCNQNLVHLHAVCRIEEGLSAQGLSSWDPALAGVDCLHHWQVRLHKKPAGLLRNCNIQGICNCQSVLWWQCDVGIILNCGLIWRDSGQKHWIHMYSSQGPKAFCWKCRKL